MIAAVIGSLNHIEQESVLLQKIMKSVQCMPGDRGYSLDSSEKMRQLKPWLADAMKGKYTILRFEAQLFESCILPTYKTSALRGGMGQMLLDTNCIMSPQGDCDHCIFPEECLVQRILYSKMGIPIEFMNSGNSVGYVIECEDYHTDFRAGDLLLFNLVLLGKNVMYFSQYLNAFFMLGAKGIGKEKGRFHITRVANSSGETVFDGRSVQIEKYKVQTIDEYVMYRTKQLRREWRAEYAPTIKITFKSPLEMKYRGEKLKEFIGDAMVTAIIRRLRMLNAFEGRDIGKPDLSEIYSSGTEIDNIVVRQCRVPRYSFHKRQKVWMQGIEGKAELYLDDFSETAYEDILGLLLAGELIHIGSNTSYGFGRYRLR